MRHPGEVLSRARLTELALDRPIEAYDRSIDTLISKLRRKLAAAGVPGDCIRRPARARLRARPRGPTRRRSGRADAWSWDSGRLYWRIALYIGIALVAFVLLGIGSVGFVASRRAGELRRHPPEPPRSRGGARAVGAEGRPALAALAAQRRRSPRRHHLCPRQRRAATSSAGAVAAGVRRLRAPAPWSARRRHPTRNYRPVRLAPQLIGPDGEAYAFLVLPNRIKLWGSAATALGLAARRPAGHRVRRLAHRPDGRPARRPAAAAVRELARGRIDARVPAEHRRRAATSSARSRRTSTPWPAQLAGPARGPGAADGRAVPRAALAAGAAAGRDGPGRPASRRESAREAAAIEQEIRRMDRVIGDLLRYSRLGAAGTVARRLVRLDALIGELCRRRGDRGPGPAGAASSFGAARTCWWSAIPNCSAARSRTSCATRSATRPAARGSRWTRSGRAMTSR